MKPVKMCSCCETKPVGEGKRFLCQYCFERDGSCHAGYLSKTDTKKMDKFLEEQDFQRLQGKSIWSAQIGEFFAETKKP